VPFEALGRTILIVRNPVDADAGPEDQDTLTQAADVEAALRALGFDTALATFARKQDGLSDALRTVRPPLVFNLVETPAGQGRDVDLAPRLLERFGVAYTGCSADALALTNDKLRAKAAMRDWGLPTADWIDGDGRFWGSGEADRFIVKSVDEHASHGLDDTSVVEGADRARDTIAQRTARCGGRWFAERYVHGREFNLSVIWTPQGPKVLPIAEMRYLDWPDGKPKILGHAAKWREGTFEYENTRRLYDPLADGDPMKERLEGLALRCWRAFGLTGYARVDFRADAQGEPYILEINANPGLGPDGGMPAACERAGMSFEGMIARFVQAAFRPDRGHA
jgi:D-alanine-D-alanine ligase